jgi:hypothetical protein
VRARAAAGGLASIGGSALAAGRWGVIVVGIVLLALVILVAAVLFSRDDQPARRLVDLLSVKHAPPDTSQMVSEETDAGEP